MGCYYMSFTYEDTTNYSSIEHPLYLFKELEEDTISPEFFGGFLTGAAIDKGVKNGLIKIEPYTSDQLNPNSYNVTIGNEILICQGNDKNQDGIIIDIKRPINYEKSIIPDEGMLLQPNNLYLISTREVIGSDYYIPMLTGRSSMGRAGISVHQEAGFGDIGYYGKWTLQVTVTYPTIIYPNMTIAQMYMVVPSGDIGKLYNGKYQGSDTARGSESYKDFT